MLVKKDLIFVIIIVLSGIVACTRNITCPAFQSQYLIDEEARHDKFTLFNPDSTPRNKGIVKKNKHGLAARKSYVRKTDEMRTILMVKRYPEIKDSIQMLRSGEIAGTDSTAAASSRYMTVVNNDQLIYNALYGSLLHKKEKPEENMSEELKGKKNTDQTEESSSGKKRSIFNIFRKKDKSDDKDSVQPGQQTPQQNARPADLPSNPTPSDSTQQDDGF